MQQRSVVVDEENIKQAKFNVEHRGGCSSPLTIILDSWANLNIFRNSDLLELIKKILAILKYIPGVVVGLFHCDMIGSLTSNLGDIPLPDYHYYYSPNIMANIPSLAILSKTHCIYMDINLDNAFYVFNQKGWYFHFYNCSLQICINLI